MRHPDAQAGAAISGVGAEKQTKRQQYCGNQVRGAVAGGLLLGVIDNLAAAYVSAQYRAAVPLCLLILIILFRPQGLLGRPEERTI